MQEIIQLTAAVVGSIGFGIVFHMRPKKLKWAALGGFLSWASYLVLVHAGLNEYLCGFIAAALTTAYAEIMARSTKTPAIIYVVVSTVPLIPGAALYRSMNALLRQDMTVARAQGLYALIFATSMAAGIVLTTLFERMAVQRSAAENKS
ncbi:MAG: threonine/serine exporter family protein [Lachnospiraceae bacterium]|nr:threonine/serine exporter family protein [Lachnospiraceae bacterium]